MALTKQQKKEIVEDLKQKIADQKAMVLVGISGLKVKELTELRQNLKAVGANIKVIKKTLAALAFKKAKIDFDKNKFKEEIGFVFGFKDEVMPAKEVYKIAKENENLKILGGYLENQYKEKEEIVALAQFPTREELLAKMVRSLKSPISGFATVLQGNTKKLVYVLSQIKPSI